MKAILYTIHCPQCNVIEAKLKEANVDYEIVTDQDLMIKKGFDSVPILEVDGRIMKFKEAKKWLDEMKNINNTGSTPHEDRHKAD